MKITEIEEKMRGLTFWGSLRIKDYTRHAIILLIFTKNGEIVS